MLKIGQNWGKIANYPPNAQQKFAPLGYTPPPPRPLNTLLLKINVLDLA